ncbi:MAG: hypothetical protein LBS04_06650 [Tannerellaceae bacterium]|jgi:hypothetical protein|nr:hypothetical protein [Tannerellaceae bacterium]
MKTYLKEILIGLFALLIMSLVIGGYIRSTKIQQSNTRVDIYNVIPPDVNALLAVNRPSVFNSMILEKQALYNVFVSQIPSLFLSFVRESQHLQSLVLSFHSQGVICYVQGGDRMMNAIEKMLKGHFKAYKPVKMNVSGMAFYYYADVNNRFFGYFTYNGVWVGSYSKKLLEKVAEQQLNPDASFPEEMKQLRSSFDTNAPLNIIFPTKGLNLYVLEGGTPAWRITDKWLAADLFLSEENLCCYGFLPNEQNKTLAMYKSMGDTISARIRGVYSSVRLSFRIDREREWVYYTGCMPVRE